MTGSQRATAYLAAKGLVYNKYSKASHEKLTSRQRRRITHKANHNFARWERDLLK